MEMDLAKVEAIKNWPNLQTVHDMRSFMGLCSYHKRIIKGLAGIAAPLHGLMKKGVSFVWGTKQTTAFQRLKEKLMIGPNLKFLDLQRPSGVHCGACGRSLGAMLQQDGYVIAYENRLLTETDKVAQIYAIELLAIIYALSSWKCSLLIVYVEGKKNVVADSLSCKSQGSTVRTISHHEIDDVREQHAADLGFDNAHGGWLPPWTSMRLVELQAIVVKHWSKYGQPVVDKTVERASEKVSVAQKWINPYHEKLKAHAQENLRPAFERKVESVSTMVLSHFERVKSTALEGYQASKDFISPQLKKVQDAMEPHIQVARETCRPYVEEAASLLRPCYEQVQSLTKPYTNRIGKGYRRFLTSATTYHKQLQVSMKGKMEKVDFLALLASNELVWFLSAALLVLPPLFICMFLSSALAPRKKPVRGPKSHHGGSFYLREVDLHVLCCNSNGSMAPEALTGILIGEGRFCL
ncbi:hypothetical protein L7F22_002618 [Adiantum nelumboides]|nr:hypothetical protein [Adiantum nelumboides]